MQRDLHESKRKQNDEICQFEYRINPWDIKVSVVEETVRSENMSPLRYGRHKAF